MSHPVLENTSAKKTEKKAKTPYGRLAVSKTAFKTLIKVRDAISNNGIRPGYSHSLKMTINLANWITVTCILFAVPYIFVFAATDYVALYFSAVAVSASVFWIMRQGWHRLARLLLVHGVPLVIFASTVLTHKSAATGMLSTNAMLVSALVIPLIVFRTSEIYWIIESVLFIGLLLFSVGYGVDAFPYKLHSSRQPDFEAVHLVSVIEAALFAVFAFGYHKFLIDSTTDRVRYLLRDIRVQNEKTQQTNEELKASEQQLKELNDAKSKLFSIIAHDLRAPMNSFKGFSGLLINDIDSLSKEDVKVLVKGMGRSFNNVNTLLENLLQWSRIQMDTVSYQPAVTDLSVLIADNLNLVESMAAEKEIAVAGRVGDDLYALVDKNVFNVVLRNLLTNAIKFTNAKGRVEVRAWRDADIIRIEVADNGVGMSLTTLENLFTSQDYHYSSLGTANERGTGLGLMLCKEFVEKWNGEIGAASVKGEGSTFYFTIQSYQDPLFTV